MKTKIGTLVLLSQFLLLSKLFAQGAEIGSSLPLADKPMISATGETVTLKQLMGEKGLVIAFWSNTCPWVKKYEERFIQLAKTYQAKGFQFVAVNANDPKKYPEERREKMQAIAKSKRYPFTYLVDQGSQLAKALGASRTPHIYLFDNQGTLRYVGSIDDNASNPNEVEHNYLKDALEALLQGKPVPIEKTKAFGCTIKFYSEN